MLLDDLTDHERALVLVALKFWRSQRGNTATRRGDPPVAPDALDLLVAKLEAQKRFPADDLPADLFPE